MILRLKDWAKYPSAIVDNTTNNTSFIHLAQLYKEMGVANHAFPLALHNPELQGIDPHSENLTIDEMQMIALEVTENPWYFYREIIRIPVTGVSSGIPFKANRANIAFLWSCYSHISVMLIQPRQTGKSVAADSNKVYILSFGGSNIKMILFTKDDNLRTANIERIKAMFELLPWYLNPRTKKDSNNTENITISALNNRLDTVVGQSSVAGAMKVGRGLTVAMLDTDEGPFIPNVDVSLQTAIPGTSAAREAAAATGGFYFNTYTTTPGFLSTKSGQYMKKIYDGSTRWTEKLLDVPTIEELHDVVRKGSRGGRLQLLLEFNHRQLGKTDEWLRQRILEIPAAEKDMIEADFLNKWSYGNIESPISKENIAKIRESMMDPLYIDISKDGYITNWYIPEEQVINNIGNRQIVMGLDTSEAIGNDSVCLCGRDVSTGEIIVTGEYNDSNTITLSKHIADMLVKYPNIILIPEIRSTGISFLDNIVLILMANNIDPFTRIYNQVVNDSDIEAEYKSIMSIAPYRRAADETIYNEYRKQFGYRTSAFGRAARNNLYGDAFNFSIRYTAGLTRDKTLISQLEGLEKRDGRIDHPKDGNDDMVIASMLSMYLLTKGKNLSYYGLDSTKVLAAIKVAKTDESGGVSGYLYREKQNRLKMELDDLLEKLKNTRDEFIKIRLLSRVKVIYSEIDQSLITSLNMEDLIRQIEESKTLTAYSGTGKRYAF